MSAFVCNNSHITALAAYASRHGIPQTLEEIGGILHAENVKSVNHRYGEQEEPSFEVCPWAKGWPFTPIQIIKAVRCLEYQSCEHPGWPTSHANEILDRIMGVAIGELPGYEVAEWEIRSQATIPAA